MSDNQLSQLVGFATGVIATGTGMVFGLTVTAGGAVAAKELRS